MTRIWLSQGLPAPEQELATALGSEYELVGPLELPPPGTGISIVTVHERALLERLAQLPRHGSLLLVRPPGYPVPADLPLRDEATVVEASSVPELTAAVRDLPVAPVAGSPVSGPAPSAAVGSERAVEPRHSRRYQVLTSAGVLAASAAATVLVLVLGSSDAVAGSDSQGGGARPGGFGNQGFGGQGFGGQGFGGQGFGGQGFAGQQGPATQGTTQQGVSNRQQLLNCLSVNGVQLSGTGRRVQLDPSDPAVAAALQKCITR